MLTPNDSSTSSSEPRAARWLGELLPSCLAVLLAFGFALYGHRDALNESGIGGTRLERATLPRLERWADAPKPGFPRVVLFGDSLNMCGDRETGARDLVGRALRSTLARRGLPIDLLDMTNPGLRPLHFYALLDDVLDAGAQVVVVEVNLRTFLPKEALPGRARLPHLARKLDLRDAIRLREALALDGLTVLDPAVIRLKEQLGLLFAFEGLRSSFLDRLRAESSRLTRAIGLRPLRPQMLVAYARGLRALHESDYAAHPNVELLRAIRERARARGVPVLFYVSPVRPQAPAQRDHARRLATRIDELRRAVGATRGEWLDLHATLPLEMFRDTHNHLRHAGCGRVGTPIAQRLSDVLPRTRPVRAASR